MAALCAALALLNMRTAEECMRQAVDAMQAAMARTPVAAPEYDELDGRLFHLVRMRVPLLTAIANAPAGVQTRAAALEAAGEQLEEPGVWGGGR